LTGKVKSMNYLIIEYYEHKSKRLGQQNGTPKHEEQVTRQNLISHWNLGTAHIQFE